MSGLFQGGRYYAKWWILTASLHYPFLFQYPSVPLNHNMKIYRNLKCSVQESLNTCFICSLWTFNLLLFDRPMIFTNLKPVDVIGMSEMTYLLLEERKAFKLLGILPSTLFRWERITVKRWITKWIITTYTYEKTWNLER